MNWGIIGLGKIAEVFSNAFEEAENAQLLAVASREQKKLNQFKSGDKVQISDGPFENYMAIFKCYRSDERVTLLMNLLGRQQSLCMKKESVIAL